MLFRSKIDTIHGDFPSLSVLLHIFARDIRQIVLNTRKITAEFAPQHRPVCYGTVTHPGTVFVVGEDDITNIELGLEVSYEWLHIVEILFFRVENDELS